MSKKSSSAVAKDDDITLKTVKLEKSSKVAAKEVSSQKQSDSNQSDESDKKDNESDKE